MTHPVINKHVSLRGAAREVMANRDGEVVLAGPAGTGKSFAALNQGPPDGAANPGMRALMVRKTHRA
jgi:hypothetical protein